MLAQQERGEAVCEGWKVPPRDPSKFIAAVSGGWPKVVSNLKSLLETGAIALRQASPTYAAQSAKA